MTINFADHTISHLLGINSSLFSSIPWNDKLSMIKEVGFQTTSVMWWLEGEHKDLTSINQLPDKIRKSGLILEYIHAPYQNCGNLWNPDKEVRAEIMKDHFSWIEDCKTHDVPTLVIHLSRSSRPVEVNTHGVDIMKKIIERAERLNINIAVENMKSIEHVEEIFSKIKSSNLKFCYDSSHDWLYRKEKVKLLDIYGHLIAAIHLSDNDGIEDRHWLPEEGIIDWKLVMQSLKRANYKGSFFLEVFPKDNFKENKQNCYNFFQSAFDKALKLKKIFLNNP